MRLGFKLFLGASCISQALQPILAQPPIRRSQEWSPNTVLVISKDSIHGDCTIRPSITINGTSPGPELRFKEGQKIWIRVINQLLDHNTTLHFHGLSQYGSPFADGTPKTAQVSFKFTFFFFFFLSFPKFFIIQVDLEFLIPSRGGGKKKKKLVMLTILIWIVVCYCCQWWLF